MTFAHHIIEAVGSEADQAQGGAIARLAEKIVAAEHFVFGETAYASLSQVAHSKPSSLLAALPLCKLPFPCCWFEWPGSLSAYAHPWENGHTGVLISSEPDPQCFLLTFAWEISTPREGAWQPNINISPLSIYADWAPDPDPRLVNVERQAWNDNPHAIERYFPKGWLQAHPDEFAAIRELMARCVGIPAVSILAEQHLRRIESLPSACWNLITGQPANVIAALCLLNSRNCVEVEKVDLTRLNKARLRRGKAPRLGYSTVRIALSKAQQRMAAAAGLSEAEIRRHLVRGHFKLKFGKLWWWRPHVRGSHERGEIRHEAYEVTA